MATSIGMIDGHAGKSTCTCYAFKHFRVFLRLYSAAMPTRAVPSEEDLDKLVCLLLSVGCPKALLSFGD